MMKRDTQGGFAINKPILLPITSYRAGKRGDMNEAVGESRSLASRFARPGVDRRHRSMRAADDAGKTMRA